MTRRDARELVIHLLFENEYSGEGGESLLKNRLEKSEYTSLASEYELYAALPDEKQMEYIQNAVMGVIAHIPELDAYIEKYSKGWNVGRISRISKCILRLCMYELIYLQIPVGASVNEALEMAKKYDSDEAAKFINGIMGAFVKQELTQP